MYSERRLNNCSVGYKPRNRFKRSPGRIQIRFVKKKKQTKKDVKECKRFFTGKTVGINRFRNVIRIAVVVSTGIT